MPKPSHRTSLIAGFVAAVVFVGAVAGNLIAIDLQRILQPFSLWVWLTGAIAHAEQALTIREHLEDPTAEKVHAKLAVWHEETNT